MAHIRRQLKGAGSVRDPRHVMGTSLEGLGSKMRMGHRQVVLIWMKRCRGRNHHPYHFKAYLRYLRYSIPYISKSDPDRGSYGNFYRSYSMWITGPGSTLSYQESQQKLTFDKAMMEC